MENRDKEIAAKVRTLKETTTRDSVAGFGLQVFYVVFQNKNII